MYTYCGHYTMRVGNVFHMQLKMSYVGCPTTDYSTGTTTTTSIGSDTTSTDLVDPSQQGDIIYIGD